MRDGIMQYVFLWVRGCIPRGFAVGEEGGGEWMLGVRGVRMEGFWHCGKGAEDSCTYED